jgi:hypothetical protein
VEREIEREVEREGGGERNGGIEERERELEGKRG